MLRTTLLYASILSLLPGNIEISGMRWWFEVCNCWNWQHFVRDGEGREYTAIWNHTKSGVIRTTCTLWRRRKG